MAGAWGYIISALIAGIFGIAMVLLQIRGAKATKKVHEEVRTNHGIRQGQRIEDLGLDLEIIKRMMVTKPELDDHAKHDLAVAEDLKKQNLETRSIILAAIRLQGDKP